MSRSPPRRVPSPSSTTTVASASFLESPLCFTSSIWRPTRMIQSIVLMYAILSLFQESRRARFQLQPHDDVVFDNPPPRPPLLLVLQHVNQSESNTTSAVVVTTSSSPPSLPTPQVGVAAASNNNTEPSRNNNDNNNVVVGMSDSYVPRNLRLLLVGDSVTRYQYLSLIHYLRHGTWEDTDISDDHPRRMVCEKDYPSWSQFFEETNRQMAPYEWCDCYRENVTVHVDDMMETRYYHDPRYDNYVYYVPKFGPATLKGYWEPETLSLAAVSSDDYGDGEAAGTYADHQYRSYNQSKHMRNTSRLVPPTWEYTWSNLGDYVSRLKLSSKRNNKNNNNDKKTSTTLEPPTHVILNGGLWGSDLEIRNATHQDALIQGLRLANVTIIYKTTTAMRPPASQQRRRLKSQTGGSTTTPRSSSSSSSSRNKEGGSTTTKGKKAANKKPTFVGLKYKKKRVAATAAAKAVTGEKKTPQPQLEPYEKRLCSLADHCFDLRWTSNLTSEYYWDRVHFYEPVYRWINQDLLALLTGRTTTDNTAASGSPPFHSWTALQGGSTKP